MIPVPKIFRIKIFFRHLLVEWSAALSKLDICLFPHRFEVTFSMKSPHNFSIFGYQVKENSIGILSKADDISISKRFEIIVNPLGEDDALPVYQLSRGMLSVLFETVPHPIRERRRHFTKTRISIRFFIMTSTEFKEPRSRFNAIIIYSTASSQQSRWRDVKSRQNALIAKHSQ